MLPFVTVHSSFTKSVIYYVSRRVRSGVVLSGAWSEKSMDSIGGIYVLLSQQMLGLAVIKHVVDDNNYYWPAYI